MTEVYEPERPRRRRGRKLLTVLLVLLLLLAAGLVALDRVGSTYAERELGARVSQEMAKQQSTSGKPDVTIAGVPFLTQVVSGKYQEVRIQLPDFAGPDGNGGTVRMSLLDISAKDLRAPLNTVRTGQGDIVAGQVTGIGTIDYTQLADLIGQEGLQLAEKDGKLVGSAPLKALGQTFDVSGTADLAVTNGVVQVRFSDVTAANLPDNPFVQNLVAGYAKRLGFDVPVPQLPLSLAVRDVAVLPEGLRVTAGAEEVNLSASGV